MDGMGWFPARAGLSSALVFFELEASSRFCAELRDVADFFDPCSNDSTRTAALLSPCRENARVELKEGILECLARS